MSFVFRVISFKKNLDSIKSEKRYHEIPVMDYPKAKISFYKIQTPLYG
jgi:hypothetical protein